MAQGASNNPYAQYQTQNVMTASPGELTLMLYDGAIKNIRLAAHAMEEKQLERAHECLIKAQAILGELQGSLRGEEELVGQLNALYDFITGELVNANVKKEAGLLNDPLELLLELRETWQEAVLINRKQQYGVG
ncbi:flagellar export chaperone FliS [Oscillospiraceae bacterium OttesenSCG-928-G22]|nr:flagellar export chaperone FliS [Oscillospiraceae bacterium OttesenSCG-928-G22]